MQVFWITLMYVSCQIYGKPSHSLHTKDAASYRDLVFKLCSPPPHQHHRTHHYCSATTGHGPSYRYHCFHVERLWIRPKVSRFRRWIWSLCCVESCPEPNAQSMYIDHGLWLIEAQYTQHMAAELRRKQSPTVVLAMHPGEVST